jgi:hypothetical protein
VRFRLLDNTEKVQPRPTFDLGFVVPGEKQRIKSWRSPDLLMSREPEDDLPPSPFAQDDGSFLIEHLQPGQYALQLRHGRRSKTLAVEVKARETTTVDVRVEDLNPDPVE